VRPTAPALVSLAAQLFSVPALLHAEVQVVRTLLFELHPPTAWGSLALYCGVLKLTPLNERATYCLTSMLLDCALLRPATLAIAPSLLAAAALFLAVTHRLSSFEAACSFWEGSVQLVFDVSPTRPPLADAIRLVREARALPHSGNVHAINLKYATPANASVASIELQ
jgi:hypothetical protein